MVEISVTEAVNGESERLSAVLPPGSALASNQNALILLFCVS